MHRHWTLDPSVTYLNHGSFGACPKEVLEAQSRWRARMEEQPMRFFVRDIEANLDAARAAVAAFVDADTAGLAFVANATAGVNAVLRSLELEPGAELLTTDHVYNAVRNVMEHVAARARGRVVVVEVPFPIGSGAVAVERVTAAVTPRTRLAVLDHVTSPTALVLPIAELVEELAARGVDTLVDGAHAPGMVDVSLRELGAAYYTANLHKWVCAPKGAAFLHVREDRRAGIRPPVISHGANSPRGDRSRFHLEFDWTGTGDPTPWLAAPEAIRVVGSLLPGGWPAVREANRALAREARDIVCRALGVPPPAPDGLLGSMAAVPLPGRADVRPAALFFGDPLQDALLERHAIEVPVMSWPAPPRRLLRVSAQLYNTRADYERLAGVLPGLLAPLRAH